MNKQLSAIEIDCFATLSRHLHDPKSLNTILLRHPIVFRTVCDDQQTAVESPRDVVYFLNDQPRIKCRSQSAPPTTSDTLHGSLIDQPVTIAVKECPSLIDVQARWKTTSTETRISILGARFLNHQNSNINNDPTNPHHFLNLS